MVVACLGSAFYAYENSARGARDRVSQGLGWPKAMLLRSGILQNRKSLFGLESERSYRLDAKPARTALRSKLSLRFVSHPQVLRMRRAVVRQERAPPGCEPALRCLTNANKYVDEHPRTALQS